MNPNKRSPLGRGLESLIPRDETVNQKAAGNDRLIDIDITDIKPNDRQPRYDFDEGAMAALTESIRSKGLLQPIVVIKDSNGYMLISGERRWRASGLAGLKKIPAVVLEKADDNERLELALIENTQRDDLKPLELANAYSELVERAGYRQEDVARIAGRSRSAVANTLRLLELSSAIKGALDKKVISEGHARVFLTLPETLHTKLLNQIVTKSLSVRQTEALAKQMQNDVEIRTETKETDPNMLAMEKEMEGWLGSQVRLRPKSRGQSGVIEIRYASHDELDKILHKLRGDS